LLCIQCFIVQPVTLRHLSIRFSGLHLWDDADQVLVTYREGSIVQVSVWICVMRVLIEVVEAVGV